MANQNIVIIVRVWFIFQIFFHQLMSMRSHCFMLSLNLIISYEPSLFQKYLPLHFLCVEEKKGRFIGCGGKNLKEEQILML